MKTMLTAEMLSGNRTKGALYQFTLQYILKGKLAMRNLSKSTHVPSWLGCDDMLIGENT